MVIKKILQFVFIRICFVLSSPISKKLADGEVAPDQYRFVVAIEVFYKDNNKWGSIWLTGTLVKFNNKFACITSAHMIGRNHSERLLAAKPFNNNFMKFSRPMRIRFGSNIVQLQKTIMLSPESRISIFPRSYMNMDGYNYANVQDDLRFDVIFIPIFPSEAKRILKGSGEFLDWSNLPNFADYTQINYCKILAFGSTAGNVDAKQLYSAELIPITIDKCETNRYTKLMWQSHMDQYKYICHRTLLTAKLRLPSVMPGDSGSPIICNIGGRSHVLFICSGAFAYRDDSYIRSVDSKVIFDYYRLAMQLF